MLHRYGGVRPWQGLNDPPQGEETQVAPNHQVTPQADTQGNQRCTQGQYYPPRYQTTEHYSES